MTNFRIPRNTNENEWNESYWVISEVLIPGLVRVMTSGDVMLVMSIKWTEPSLQPTQTWFQLLWQLKHMELIRASATCTEAIYTINLEFKS